MWETKSKLTNTQSYPRIQLSAQPKHIPYPRTMGEATTTPLEELLPWLNRIDTLIHKAVLLAESLYSPDRATAPYRGLQISLEEVELLLQRHPAEPLFAAAAPETASPPATSR
ncbi:hypothetical protein QT990_33020, partial [Microcoleus sp. T3_B1]|uniref:hypothetical protein n=1 Tax=Microcoleus sp. T3_B1 TaxID=3055425 RepID=UPI002FD1D8AC